MADRGAGRVAVIAADVVALAAIVAACRAAPATSTAPTLPPATSTAAAPPTTPAATPSPSPTPSPPMPPVVAPPACAPPPDDAARVTINGETITGRTRAMLEAAQALYDGPGDLLRIVQGSYTDDVAGSFGTHAGGGAVDLSIRDPRRPEVRLFGDVEAMVAALRQAGFAAWYRGPDEVFAGSVPHLHAIAVGDPELAPAAVDQLIGPAGYFRGFNGLPHDPPVADAHGGPVVCGWMVELGYRDMR